MIQKKSYLGAIFMIISSLHIHASYSPKTSPSQQTPHPSNHSDETNSSSLNPSESTMLASVSSRSLTPSPEPQNPALKNIQEICKVINVNPENLLEEAQKLTLAKADPKTLSVLKQLLNLGLNKIVSIAFAPDDETGTPVGYTPNQITIRDLFWKKHKTEREIIFAQVVNRLNNKASELQTLAEEQLIEQDADLEKFKALQKAMIIFYKTLDNEAIENLINKAYNKKNFKKVLRLQQYLLPCHDTNSDSEEHIRSSSPEVKRLKKDPATGQ